MPDPVILAFDTAMPHCAAAIVQDFLRHQHSEPMTKGQVERLMPILEATLAHESLAWNDLDLIAVGVGPGNFTGIRIAVSAARGLGLSLGIPVMGVSMFEVMRDPANGIWANPAEIVSLEGPRGSAYVQPFRYGKPQADPQLIDPEAPPADLERPANMLVRGYKAETIARPFGCDWQTAELTDVAARIGICAAAKWLDGDHSPLRPAPLYVRPADAAPPRDPAPTILT